MEVGGVCGVSLDPIKENNTKTPKLAGWELPR